MIFKAQIHSLFGRIMRVARLVWPISAAVSVVTSKQILIHSNYHYPFRLLLLQLLVVLVLLVCSKQFRPAADATSENGAVSWVKRSKPDYLLLSSAACLAVFLPLWSQAMIHFENITTLIMLVPSVTLIGSLRLLWRHDQQRPTWFRSRICCLVLCCVLIIYDDYRLTPNGLLFGVPALLLVASAKAFFDEHVRTTETELSSITSDLVMPAISLSIFTTGLCFIFTERANGFSFPSKDMPIFFVNIMAGAIAFVLGSSVLSRSCFSFDNALSIFALVGFTALLSRWLPLPGYSSILQIVASAVAAFCSSGNVAVTKPQYASIPTIALEQIPNRLNRSGIFTNLVGADETTQTEHWQNRPSKSFNSQSGSQTWNLYQALALLVLTVPSWLWFMADNFSSTHIEPEQSTYQLRLDRNYRATSSQLDIVISMYREPVVSVKNTVSQLKQISNIALKQPRVIIYTKDPSADVESLQTHIGVNKVVKLDNKGREGHTYLHHIVDAWDDLATQTFFLQADIHNPREFFPRVRDYYGVDTGMLNLGASSTCECDRCGDRFGWYDDSSIIQSVYQEAMQRPCKDQRMLLSYKGQFVASAARIRANNITLYQGLRDAMADEDSWAHQEQYLQGRKDSLNAPFFGYTLERLWSVILQCSDMHVAAYCPTLLSGSRSGGSRADCQCFDQKDASLTEQNTRY